MKKLFILLLFFSISLSSNDNIVVVISMDGVRHDFPKLSQKGGFEYIQAEGLSASSLVPVYQSTTFPSHVSMATGVTPDKHGILHNSFYDVNRGTYSYSPDASWIESEPVWAILERNNIKTATYFWVGSGGAGGVQIIDRTSNASCTDFFIGNLTKYNSSVDSLGFEVWTLTTRDGGIPTAQFNDGSSQDPGLAACVAQINSSYTSRVRTITIFLSYL